MENASTIPWEPPPTPFPASSRSIDLSPLEFILALLAVITIPALIYAFFFAFKCPPPPFRRGNSYRTSGGEGEGEGESAAAGNDVVKPTTTDAETAAVSGRLKYKKEAHVKEMGTECPVCLSPFADGEEVKQLSACKHSFHVSCIDMWLQSQSNCPICRASVPVKRSGTSRSAAARGRDDDLQQGLPNSSSLV